MTVPQQKPIVNYVEDGATLEFPVPFYYGSPADLRAYRTAEGGALVELVNGEDFTATNGANEDGGMLTLMASVAGAALSIRRATPRKQDTDYETNGVFTAESHERALDRAVLMAQEQDEEIERALKVSFGKTAPEVGEVENGQVLGLANGRIVGVTNDIVAAEDAKAAAIAARLETEGLAAEAETAKLGSEDARDAALAAQSATEARVALIEEVAGASVYPTWAELAAATGMVAGDTAVIFEDDATHTDPITAATVSNSGLFIYRDQTDPDPDGWERFGDALEAVRQADRAEAAATSAAEVTKRANAWPDSEFKLSGGDIQAELAGFALYGNRGAASNAEWDADFAHPYGRGAWAYNPALATLQYYETHFDGPGTDEFDFSEGDVISIAMEVIAPSGTVSLAARFVSAFNPTNYTYAGGQISGSSGVAMDGTSKILKVENMTVPAGAVGLLDYIFDGTSSAFRVVRRWVVKGPLAGDAPPIRSSEWERQQVTLEQTVPTFGGAAWGFALGTQFDSIDTVIEATDQSIFGSSTSVITGWGDVLAPADVSFNGIRVSGITVRAGTNEAAELLVAIRKGAVNASHLAGSTLVAMGRGTVTDGEAIVALEMDGEFVTLSDADLNTDEYIVMWQALDANGNPTSPNQARGTLSNRVGRSYYIVSGDIETVGYAPVTGAPPINVEHVLLENPAFDWRPSSALESEVEKIAENYSTTPPRLPHGQRLRRFRSFAEQREAGEAARFQMGLIGDSWSTNADYFSAPFSRAMKALYGDGGVGWFGMGFTGGGSTAGDADGVYYATRTGTWTSNYAAGSTSPNVSDARSSTAGSIYQIRNVSGASRPALSAVLLQYTGTADAVIRWRWQGGEWSANTPAQTAGQNTVNLTGFPSGALSSAGANTDNLEIEVVSGSVIPCGIDFQSDTDGIVIHKLGASGSKATDWLTSNAATWQAGLALLGIDGASILFGTNEDANGQAAGTIAGAYEDLAARVQAAVPAADMLLAVAPENQLVNSTDMTTYASAIAALVAGVSPTVFAAFCDLQPAYGDPGNKAEYASDGDFPLLNADGVHPNADGARVNAREMRLTWTVR